MNETITVKGSVKVTLTGPDGKVKQEHTGTSSTVGAPSSAQ